MTQINVRFFGSQVGISHQGGACSMTGVFRQTPLISRISRHVRSGASVHENAIYADISYRGSEGTRRGLPGGEVRVSQMMLGRCKREDEGGGGRRKNETAQLGQEICGKLPTKAQENWEDWGRSSGSVPGPVRGRPPHCWFD